MRFLYQGVINVSVEIRERIFHIKIFHASKNSCPWKLDLPWTPTSFPLLFSGFIQDWKISWGKYSFNFIWMQCSCEGRIIWVEKASDIALLLSPRKLNRMKLFFFLYPPDTSKRTRTAWSSEVWKNHKFLDSHGTESLEGIGWWPLPSPKYNSRSRGRRKPRKRLWYQIYNSLWCYTYSYGKASENFMELKAMLIIP